MAGYTTGLPKQIHLRVGTEARVPLLSAAAAGYLWDSSPSAGESAVAAARLETGPPPPQEDLPSNLPATVTLVVSGQEIGTIRFHLRLSRPWMPDAPLAEHEIEVVVTL